MSNLELTDALHTRERKAGTAVCLFQTTRGDRHPTPFGSPTLSPSTQKRAAHRRLGSR